MVTEDLRSNNNDYYIAILIAQTGMSVPQGKYVATKEVKQGTSTQHYTLGMDQTNTNRK